MQTMSNQQIILGQPLAYPNELVSHLKLFFGDTPTIKKAFLACIQYPEAHLSPELLIGLDTTNDLEKIVGLFEEYMSGKSLLSESLKFVDAKSAPFQAYFAKVQPIYEQ